MSLRLPACLAVALLMAFLPGINAFGSLGGDDASIGSESRKFHAERTIQQLGHYRMHELKQRKRVVREYQGADGKVFAVTWHGSAHADLGTLMGDRLADFRKALGEARRRQHGRGPIAIDVGNMHLEMAGHMRSVHGRAWLIDQVPNGVATDEIR